MRKSTLARLLFSVTAVTGLTVWAACGGSDAQDVVSPDAGGQDTGRQDTGYDEEDTGTQDSGKPDTGKADTGTGGYDAGDTVVLPDPTGTSDAGIPCYAGMEAEQEPNDEKAIANPIRDISDGGLRPGRCGYVVVPDAGPLADGGEDDWLSFQLGDASSNFFVYYEGDINAYVEVADAGPYDITAKPSPTLPIVKGQPYYLRVKARSNRTAPWRIQLCEEPAFNCKL